MQRVCDNCRTPLSGKKGHGFIIRGRLLCGRAKIEKTVYNSQGTASLKEVKVKGCS